MLIRLTNGAARGRIIDVPTPTALLYLNSRQAEALKEPIETAVIEAPETAAPPPRKRRRK